MHKPFVPSRLLANRHLQTLSAALPVLQKAPAGVLREHLTIALPNGLGALHACAFWQPFAAPAVLVLHGVGGTSESTYVQRAAIGLVRAGYHAVCLDMRGAGRGGRWVRTLYHAGLTTDINVALTHLAALANVTHLGLLGFSLGGQLALLAASEWATQGPAVRAVVAISAPMDLDTACTLLDTNPNAVYRMYILRGLVRMARRLVKKDPTAVALSLRELSTVRYLRDYDNQVIAPMHGFMDAADYYAQAACGPQLHRISAATLCVHAEDDPIVPFSTLQPYFSHASAAVTWAHSEKGGHVGFIGGLGHLRQSWALQQALAFLATQMQAGQADKNGAV